MTFLTATWKNLIMVNYHVDPELLKPYLPKETELDFYKDKCYLSLVGFMFDNTRVLGTKFPFHSTFEEVNLRFYVKKGDKKGVVFIKEIVPKKLIEVIANKLFKERYISTKMQNISNSSQIGYSWKANGYWQSLTVDYENKLIDVNPEAKEEFITEHYFGYSGNNHKSYEYEVTHPKWQLYPVKNHDIKVDFEKSYGIEFNFLNTKKPESIFLVKGSPISVKWKRKIS